MTTPRDWKNLTEMKNPVKEIFDRIAPRYDRVNGLLTLRRVGAMRRRLVSEIPHRPNLRVLDLCAGTLECSKEVFARFPDAHVTAVDISGEMLRVGFGKLNAKERERIRVVQGDVLGAELPAGSFDAALCAWGIRNVEDRGLLLRRVRSWLAPGGRLLVLELFRPKGALGRFFLKTVGGLAIPLVGALAAGESSA
ncbi:MAG TPA: class I SAM-dependent methyltransferase, partial [bacterium]|nr:class I SAM-dependent methyltransferase [bacterium]